MKSRSWLAWAVLATTVLVGSRGWGQDRTVPPAPRRLESPPPAAPSLVPPKLSAAAPGAKAGQPADDAEAGLFDDIDSKPIGAGTTMSGNDIRDLLNRHAEQTVTLEWIGPVQIKVGQPFVYEIVVRNIATSPVANVSVRNKFAEGMTIQRAEPEATPEADGLSWNLGALEPRQEKRIKLELIADRRGEVACNATVTATTPHTTRFRVSEPQLVLKQSAPERVMIGDPVTITLSVTNPGDGAADKVVIRSSLSDGLKNEKGKSFAYELGTLAAGETRTMRLVCSTIKGGPQLVQSVATADGGLQANAESTTVVTEPKLALSISGPKLRYLERNATYIISATNPGDAPATNVKILATLPAGFKPLKSTAGGQHDYTTRSITWFLGDINPGEKKEVAYQCVAMQAGAQQHHAAATGQRGLKAADEITTNVEGISALLLEVVDIDDPIEVNADTAYEIRVTNQGSREATNVEIHALVPRELQVRGAQGPTNHRQDGQEIVFAPLPKLAPRADAIYRIFVRGAGVGDVRFRARLISDSLTEPVIEEESTKIYAD